MSDESNRVTCWVCFATDEDEPTATWVQPCRCRGTSRWVHQNCLQRWIDEKQRGVASQTVRCPQCNAEYILAYPRLNLIVQTMETFDRLVNRLCPVVGGGVFLGSLYWCAVTFGAVTVMQVLGHKEGLNVMEKADPLFLLMGLPAIPVCLVLGKMVRWEDCVLSFCRRHASKLPLLGSWFSLPRDCRIPHDPNSLSDPVAAVRLVCGALLIPTVATLSGKLFFKRINSNLQRTILGGMAFVGMKGISKIYYKQQQFMRQARRTVLDYEH